MQSTGFELLIVPSVGPHVCFLCRESKENSHRKDLNRNNLNSADNKFATLQITKGTVVNTYSIYSNVKPIISGAVDNI